MEFACVKGLLQKVEDLKFADDTELMMTGSDESEIELKTFFGGIFLLN